ncbi:MAG TPA: hypothetical protein DCS43_07925 [Verrucomicrobia bacterium]|nr:hypothetical protein [Verrucomicrobiota bacterium]
MQRFGRFFFPASLLLCIGGVLIIQSRSGAEGQPPVERMWPVMGTFASVTLRGDDAGRIEAVQVQTRDILDEVNRRMSVYIPESEISALNSGSTQAVAISTLTHDMLNQVRHYTQLTEGAFDATVMPLITLWGFSTGTRPLSVPSDESIRAARILTGIDRLELGADSARFTQPGMRIDLGGIAKGFAVDRCYDAITAKQPLNLIVNLGGNLRVHGTATSRRSWNIGVQHPFEKDQTLGVLTLQSGMALATSGNYERFIILNGKRYTHIIDPRTGRPVEGMAGVTVLSSTATEADALSTALFVLGIDRAAAILAKAPGSHALLVPDRQPVEIYVSAGLMPFFEPHAEYAGGVKPLPVNASGDRGQGAVGD